MPIGGQQLNTTNIGQFVDLVRRDWSIRNDFVKTGPARSMFIADPIPDNNGNTKMYTEIDVETYALLKPEGDDAAQTAVQYGYEKTGQILRFAREIRITWEMRKQNRQPEIMAQLTSLSHFCPNRMEMDLTHIISFGRDVSYVNIDGVAIDTTTGDGLPLFFSAHTLKASPQTFSNIITGNPQFSKAGLEVAETQTNTQILSQFGERRVMQWNVIFSSDDPTTVNDIKQFLRSTTDVDQNNPGVINVYLQKYEHIILPYLATNADGSYDSTKAKYWGLAAVKQAVKGWQAYLGIQENPELLTPAPGNNGVNASSDNWIFGTRCAYLIVPVSPRGIQLSTGLGV